MTEKLSETAHLKKMEIDDAMRLINYPRPKSERAQVWVDLGSGTGTFTSALARLLVAGSVIYAVDRDDRALAHIPARYKNVNIKTIHKDFVEDGLELPTADGILLANSLHFVREQKKLLQKLEKLTNRFLIVEYDNRKSSVWHPFPFDFQFLQSMFTSLNYTKIFKIGMRRSIYEGEIYSALIER